MASLILVPGMDGTGTLFDGLRQQLTDVDVRVARYAERVEDEEASIAALVRPDEPHVVLAESFGGPIAIRYAASRPAGLRGLVLVATFLSPPVPAVLAPMLAFAPEIVFDHPPPEALVRLAMTGADAHRDVVRAVRSAIASVPKGRIAGRIRRLARLDVRSLVEHTDVPALVLAGARDRLVPMERVRALHAAFVAEGRAWPLAVVDGPHLLAQVRPAACAEHVRAMLASC